jgi:hypothetical protein
MDQSLAVGWWAALLMLVGWRVLTTVLKRIVRDGGSIALHWGPQRRLPPRWLRGVLGAI